MHKIGEIYHQLRSVGIPYDQATMRTFDLASLLNPVSLDSFDAEYWERRPLFVKRDDMRYYEDLLTRPNLEDFISSADARYPAILLAKNGKFYPPQAYCEDVQMGQTVFNGVPNLKKIAAEYGKGATIALTWLDRVWRPLGELCVRLEEQLDHGIKTNVYLTAGNTSGFPPHYDTHDILLLQISGSKRWRIYEPTLPLPDTSQACDPRSFVPGPVHTELQLSAGDLLYLPRGYGHAARTTDSHSVHVSVGIHVYTWAGVLRALDASCMGREELRKSLPSGFASRAELRPVVREKLRQMAPARLSSIELDRLLDATIRTVNQLRRRRAGHFRVDATVLTAGSPVSTLPPDQYRFTRMVDASNRTQSLTLELGGQKFGFPAQLEDLLNRMCSLGRFRLNELGSVLNDSALLDLAGYLQSIGFLMAG